MHKQTTVANYIFTEQSPQDATLFYKRATAYFSLSRFENALSDFDSVLELTPDSFPKAHFMRARIYAKDARFADARSALADYQAKAPTDSSAIEFGLQLRDSEAAAAKLEGAYKAKLWTACEEAATTVLIMAPHAVDIRRKRALCALGGGDYEQALGDLTYEYSTSNAPISS